MWAPWHCPVSGDGGRARKCVVEDAKVNDIAGKDTVIRSKDAKLDQWWPDCRDGSARPQLPHVKSASSCPMMVEFVSLCSVSPVRRYSPITKIGFKLREAARRIS